MTTNIDETKIKALLEAIARSMAMPPPEQDELQKAVGQSMTKPAPKQDELQKAIARSMAKWPDAGG